MKSVALGAWMLPRARWVLPAPGLTNLSCVGPGMTMPICAAMPLDALLVGELGDAGAQQLVLALQRGAALQRAADAGVELEDLHLHGDDPGQEHAQQRDPHAARG